MLDRVVKELLQILQNCYVNVTELLQTNFKLVWSKVPFCEL